MKVRFVILAATIVLVPIVGTLAFSFVLSTSSAQMRVAAAVSHALRRPVRFASVSFRPFPVPRLRVRGLEIAERAGFGTAPLLRVDRADLRPQVAPLLRGRLELASIALKEPALSVVRDAAGRWNVASGRAAQEHEPERKTESSGAVEASAPAAPRPIDVRIEKGTVTYSRQRKNGRTDELRLEDVDLKLGGETRLTWSGEARLEPGAVGLEINDGMVELDTESAPGDSVLGARVSVDGKDVAPLFAALLGPKVAIGGALKGALQVGGTLGAPTARGALSLSGASLAMDQPRCSDSKRRRLVISSISTTGEWGSGRLTAAPTTAEIGQGKIRANLSIAFDGGASVRLDDIEASALPLHTILVDFLCTGHAVTGPLDLTGSVAIAPKGASNRLSSKGRIRIGKGKVVGAKASSVVSAVLRLGGAVSALLSADLPMALISSPLDFDSITATYAIAGGFLTFSDLAYVNQAMRVEGKGKVRLDDGRLDLDLVVNHGRGSVQAKVKGSPESPSVRVRPSTLLRDVDPRTVERGVKELLRHFR